MKRLGFFFLGGGKEHKWYLQDKFLYGRENKGTSAESGRNVGTYSELEL